MDRLNSDYLMQPKLPLNRYILDIGFLRPVLRTSLDQDQPQDLTLNLALDLVLDLVPGSQYLRS